ncbi:MAG: hypothetical protein KW804_02785 [Candidatus Doudnabacteria bacterium]|nr:hypothetical protein [Candidatus Doudnabacteria bacterium]
MRDIGSGLEQYYVNKIDRKRERRELSGQGKPAEKIVFDFHNGVTGMESRYATEEEDKGPEVGGKQTVDVIFYREGKPALASQITTDIEKGAIKKKLEEIKNHPFIRLEEMGSNDVAIPKSLIYLDAKQVSGFTKDPDFNKHPELALQIIDSHVKSLIFDISQTQNPLEQKAAQELIAFFLCHSQ